MRTYIVYLSLLPLALFCSCRHEDGKGNDPICTPRDSGSVQFWQNDSSRYAITNVSINERTEAITLDSRNGVPPCKTTGCATFRLPEGRYVYHAWEAPPGTKDWCDTIMVKKNSCMNIELR